VKGPFLISPHGAYNINLRAMFFRESVTKVGAVEKSIFNNKGHKGKTLIIISL
jgi:hypothetical protein